MADEARWYVVHTYSGYEKKVETNLKKIVENRHLQDWIHEVRVPTEIVTEVKDNKRKEVERKLFPGYVLVKMVMTDESWFVVRNTFVTLVMCAVVGVFVAGVDAGLSALVRFFTQI